MAELAAVLLLRLAKTVKRTLENLSITHAQDNHYGTDSQACQREGNTTVAPSEAFFAGSWKNKNHWFVHRFLTSP